MRGTQREDPIPLADNWYLHAKHKPELERYSLTVWQNLKGFGLDIGIYTPWSLFKLQGSNCELCGRITAVLYRLILYPFWRCGLWGNYTRQNRNLSKSYLMINGNTDLGISHKKIATFFLLYSSVSSLHEHCITSTVYLHTILKLWFSYHGNKSKSRREFSSILNISNFKKDEQEDEHCQY